MILILVYNAIFDILNFCAPNLECRKMFLNTSSRKRGRRLNFENLFLHHLMIMIYMVKNHTYRSTFIDELHQSIFNIIRILDIRQLNKRMGTGQHSLRNSGNWLSHVRSDLVRSVFFLLACWIKYIIMKVLSSRSINLVNFYAFWIGKTYFFNDPRSMGAVQRNQRGR